MTLDQIKTDLTELQAYIEPRLEAIKSGIRNQIDHLEQERDELENEDDQIGELDLQISFLEDALSVIDNDHLDIAGAIHILSKLES